MRDWQRKRHGRGALELIEEATHLLRTAPAGALACYYIGSVPFVLGLLFFWGDMSSNPYAFQHLAGAALGMTALFLWMKCWHVIFARRLRAYVAREPAPNWTLTRVRRVFVTQAVLQPIGLFLLPVAFVTVLAFGTFYAFFQNVTALEDGESTSLRVLVLRSAKQVGLWRGQNHGALVALLAFAFCVFISWLSVGLALPFLAKTLFGVQSVFNRAGGSMLNTTFFAAILGLTYLSINPIVKALYVLRCFYGESLKSGDDLKADLKQFSLQPALTGVVLALVLLGTTTLRAQEASPSKPPTQTSITPPELDRAINDTLRQNKYTWRMPREKVIEELKNTKQGPIARFLEQTATWIKEKLRAGAEWLGDFLDKLFRRKRMAPTGGSGLSWIVVQQFLLYVLALAVGIAIFFLIYRVWRNKFRPPRVVEGEAIQPAPDVADENVSAEQLPEDGWTMLARELLERGELRLALRAFYLASLAHLAGRNLISLARFKSNRDYERELQRRGHSFPNLLSLFGENILVFDRTWYGMHDTSRDLVQQFATNVDKIRAGG